MNEINEEGVLSFNIEGTARVQKNFLNEIQLKGSKVTLDELVSLINIALTKSHSEAIEKLQIMGGG